MLKKNQVNKTAITLSCVFVLGCASGIIVAPTPSPTMVACAEPVPFPGSGDCFSTPTPAPTATPTPTPTPTPPPSNQETYLGCNVFGAGDIFTTDYTSASIDANSATTITNMVSSTALTPPGTVGGKYPENFNVASNATQILAQTNSTVSPGMWSPIAGPVQVPWASTFITEGGTGLGDQHGLVINTQSCTDSWEMYQAVYNGGANTLSQGGGHDWQLGSTVGSQYAPPGHSHAANAADLPYIALTLIGDRDCCGLIAINHAMSFGYPTTNTSANGYVRPADSRTAVGCTACAATHFVYGEHLRMHAGFTMACITNSTCPQTAAIVAAMKTYGMFFEDQSPSGFVLILANNSDNTNPWSAPDLANLANIHLSDFDMLDRTAQGGVICNGFGVPPNC